MTILTANHMVVLINMIVSMSFSVSAIPAELEQLMRLREPKKRDIHRALVRTQELSDEKLQLMQQLVDTIENKSRQLESDARTLGNYHQPLFIHERVLSSEELLSVPCRSSPYVGVLEQGKFRTDALERFDRPHMVIAASS